MRSGFSPPAWIDDAARAVYESCWRFHDSSNATPDPVHGVPFGECARRGWEEVRGTAAGWCYYAANALALSSPSAEQLSELSDWAVGVAEGRGEDLFDTGHSRPFFALVEEVKRKVAAAGKAPIEMVGAGRSHPPLDPADMAAVKAIGERNRVAASNVKARGVAQ